MVCPLKGVFGFGREHVSPNRSLPDYFIKSTIEVNTMDLSNKTIEQLFMQQMIRVTKEANRKLRSIDRQFSVGA